MPYRITEISEVIHLLSLTLPVLRIYTDIHQHVAFPVCLQRSLGQYSKSTEAVQDCSADEAKGAMSDDAIQELGRFSTIT